MTMMPIYKKCPRCKKIYSWNPDVGKLWCPYCSLSGSRIIGELLNRGTKKKK